jgi:hypothetical protein
MSDYRDADLALAAQARSLLEALRVTVEQMRGHHYGQIMQIAELQRSFDPVHEQNARIESAYLNRPLRKLALVCSRTSAASDDEPGAA